MADVLRIPHRGPLALDPTRSSDDLGVRHALRGSQHAILVASATLPREFRSWAVTARRAGWLLEPQAKLFLHSEWVPAPEADPAA